MIPLPDEGNELSPPGSRQDPPHPLANNAFGVNGKPAPVSVQVRLQCDEKRKFVERKRIRRRVMAHEWGDPLVVFFPPLVLLGVVHEASRGGEV